MKNVAALVASSVVVCGLLVSACSGANDVGLFGSSSGNAGPGADSGPGTSNGGPPGSTSDDGGDGSTACTGIGCDKPTCKPGETTTLRGKVYDPAGANALFGVRVYIPNGPLPALTKGAGCDACGSITP